MDVGLTVCPHSSCPPGRVSFFPIRDTVMKTTVTQHWNQATKIEKSTS